MASVEQTPTSPTPDSGKAPPTPATSKQSPPSAPMDATNLTQIVAQLSSNRPSDQLVLAQDIRGSSSIEKALHKEQLSTIKQLADYHVRHESLSDIVSKDVKTVNTVADNVLFRGGKSDLALLNEAMGMEKKASLPPILFDKKELRALREIFDNAALTSKFFNLQPDTKSTHHVDIAKFESPDHLREAAPAFKNLAIFHEQTEQANAHVYLHASIVETLGGHEQAAMMVQQHFVDNDINVSRPINLVIVSGEEHEWEAVVTSIVEQQISNFALTQKPTSEKEEKVEVSHRTSEREKVGAQPKQPAARGRSEEKTSVEVAEGALKKAEDKAIEGGTKKWLDEEHKLAKEKAIEAIKLRHEKMDEKAQQKRLDHGKAIE